LSLIPPWSAKLAGSGDEPAKFVGIDRRGLDAWRYIERQGIERALYLFA
jgi:hypothetical protein